MLAAVSVLSLGLLLSACSTSKESELVASSPEDSFTNPVSTIGNDPYVINHGDGYLAVESKNGGLWVTQSEPGNLTGIFKSSVTEKIWDTPTAGANCKDVWAPELHLLDDAWYVYYAATTCDGDNANHRMFVLKSDSMDPLGSYTDLGPVAMREDFWAIDGTVVDLEGQRYFLWSGWEAEEDGQQNLYIAPMDSPTTLAAERVKLSEPTETWEKMAMPIQEGPQVLVKEDTTHVIYSASGSWTDDYAYGALTFQGGDVLDPLNWVKTPHALFGKTDKVTGVGHGSFVVSPDGTEDWMIYHASRAPGSGWDRVLRMQPFEWEGTKPVFGEPVGPDITLKLPSGELKP
ncbi:glycoside hydrolase family 43 protein [Jonesiaceae bacterium BS-20]|uniref:Glycoside hydrolase family 43 protein n=1 Tax=Jonesiaceae bacterium BS-20 TaxID=3120821 RepID=A0AAU7DYH9_9MICO